MKEIAVYEQACRLVAKAKTLDEAKDIRDKAIAMKVYAQQANNKDLEANAYEMRQRAERRLGELMAKMPKAKNAPGPGRGKKGAKAGVSKTPALSTHGIGKNLAKRARQLAKLSNRDFEEMVAEGREDVRHSAERAVLAKINRKEKHQHIAKRAVQQQQLTHFGPFPLLYADNPWKWGHFDEKDKENEAGKGRTPDQHYPTLTYDQIRQFHVGDKLVKDIAAEDAVLFFWCTSANFEYALQVVKDWGFTYKTHIVWVKTKKTKNVPEADEEQEPISGMGLVVRNAHETLIYATRGNMPGPQYQPLSVIMYPRGEHSAKPPEIRKIIEKMYPDFNEKTRLELFARGDVPGWSTYGFEAGEPLREAAE